jgi:hypothetical protein
VENLVHPLKGAQQRLPVQNVQRYCFDLGISGEQRLIPGAMDSGPHQQPSVSQRTDGPATDEP